MGENERIRVDVKIETLTLKKGRICKRIILTLEIKSIKRNSIFFEMKMKDYYQNSPEKIQNTHHLNANKITIDIKEQK